MLNQKKFIDQMLSFLNSSPSQFHAVKEAAQILKENGFTELLWKEQWKLQRGKKYYLIHNGSALFAFLLPRTENSRESVPAFKMIGSHTDSPTLKIKPEAGIPWEDLSIKINTEIYGGPLLYSWFDRPLSIAGRVSFWKEETGEVETELLDFQLPIAILPSIAIHLNREVNQKGMPIANQKDILPIAILEPQRKMDKNHLQNILAEKLHKQPEEILSYELNFYDTTKGNRIGQNGELISCARLDDLSMFYSSIIALGEEDAAQDSIKIIAGFDHEEVGSESKQGAASTFILHFLERIYDSLGNNRETFFRASSDSFILSADLSHALHPNCPDKNDPVLKNRINSGIAIKYNHSQNYVTDSAALSKILALCKKEKILYQNYTAHSDFRGGSTIGPKLSTLLNCSCVDAGVPILAMHSIREIGGAEDFYRMYQFMKAFLKEEKIFSSN